MQDEAPGMVFWHPKGWTLWQQVEQYMRRVYRDNGYQEVRCPQILDVSLWETIGPLGELQGEHVHHGVGEPRLRGEADELPRPHPDLQHGLRSYRDLPLRYGEFGSCHRNEPSGALHGIMRVRGFTQDDGHIFCTEDADPAGSRRRFTAGCCEVYADFGFTEIDRSSSRCGRRSALGSDEVVGQGRERAARRRCANAAWSGRSCPAKARSTARRSSIT